MEDYYSMKGGVREGRRGGADLRREPTQRDSSRFLPYLTVSPAAGHWFVHGNPWRMSWSKVGTYLTHLTYLTYLGSLGT